MMLVQGPTHTLIDAAKLDVYWTQLIHTVRRCWEYGIHANDLTLAEIEEDISLALSRFAEANGLTVPDWDAEYVEEAADA